MSPMELLCFFFLSLAVAKAIKDTFEYWRTEEEEYVPIRTIRAARVPRPRAQVTAIRKPPIQARMRRTA